MRLAIASANDFKIMWKVFKHLQGLEYASRDTEIERSSFAIIGNLKKLGSGGFTRIVMGCETMINNCCDKTSDHYDFSPEIKTAMTREIAIKDFIGGRYGSGDTAVYKGKEYPVVSIDFEEQLIAIPSPYEGCDEGDIQWVRCENVKYKFSQEAAS